MQRKTSSICGADAPHVVSVYNWEVGTFQIIDAPFPPAERADDVKRGLETWQSRMKEVAGWIVADLLTGFVSCAVTMNPHLFRMMDELDMHMERSKRRIAPQEDDRR